MTWTTTTKRKIKVPDYGRPIRREIGFSQYVSARKEATKPNKIK